MKKDPKFRIYCSSDNLFPEKERFMLEKDEKLNPNWNTEGMSSPRKKSTHKVEVVPIELLPHPDPETTNLSLVRVFGYNVIVNTKLWQGIGKGAYIVPDTLVPNVPSFEFLFTGKRSLYNLQEDGTAIKHKEGEYVRVTVIRLRGSLSHGLLVPVPEEVRAKVGDDLADVFGVERYEPAMLANTMGMVEAPPSGLHVPIYDVESIQRYEDKLKSGESVFVSEKIHGANGRWVFHEGRMWAGSHRQWKAPGAPKPTMWWIALLNSPEVEAFCRANPGVIVYGEVYGPIQKGYHYGENKPKIAVFDLMKEGKWLNIADAKSLGKTLTWTPEIGIFAFDMEVMEVLAEGETLFNASHIREGIVVKPLIERYEYELGRVQLKLVSPSYLEGKKRKRK